MAVPVAAALQNSRTEVVAGNLGGLPLLMPRYSLTYDVGMGVGIDAFAQPGLGVDALSPRYLREVNQQEQAESRRRGWARRIQRADVLGAYAITLGDASADIARYQRAVIDMDKAIALARAKQPAAVPGLVAQRDRLRALIEQLKPVALKADQPSTFATSLSDISDVVRGLGSKVVLVAALGLGALILVPMLAGRR